MLGTRHDLHYEFPEYESEIHYLKMNSAHFLRFFNEYDTVEDELHRIEQQIETPSDLYIEELKKKRLFYKDELYFMILKFRRKTQRLCTKVHRLMLD